MIIADRPGVLVSPKTPAPGKPWIWRTEFFGHEPQADIALLDRGYHVAYMNMKDMYGSPAAMELMDSFHDAMVTSYTLSSQVVLEGFSRGGLYAFNWAARRPECVAAIYADAPVCDLKSWPAGKGSGPGSSTDWIKCQKAYEMTEARLLAWPHNPIDNLASIAAARVPILIVAGGRDAVVPWEENGLLLANRYRALGGPVQTIVKLRGDHHPHSLSDPKPVVDFIIRKVSALIPARPESPGLSLTDPSHYTVSESSLPAPAR